MIECEFLILECVFLEFWIGLDMIEDFIRGMREDYGFLQVDRGFGCLLKV